MDQTGSQKKSLNSINWGQGTSLLYMSLLTMYYYRTLGNNCFFWNPVEIIISTWYLASDHGIMAHIFVLKMLTVTSLELVKKNAVATVGIKMFK